MNSTTPATTAATIAQPKFSVSAEKLAKPYRVNLAQWGSISSEKKEEIRARLYKRDGWQCHYCQIPFVVFEELTPDVMGCYRIPQDKAVACVDHILSQSLGGTNALENLVLACSRCNSLKGQKLYAEFVVKMKEASK